MTGAFALPSGQPRSSGECGTKCQIHGVDDVTLWRWEKDQRKPENQRHVDAIRRLGMTRSCSGLWCDYYICPAPNQRANLVCLGQRRKSGNVPSVSHRISGCRRKLSSAVHRRTAKLESLEQFASYRSFSRGRLFEPQVAGLRHCVHSRQHLPLTQRCCRVDLDAAPKGLNIVITGYRDCRWRLPSRSLRHCHRTRCRARASPDLDAIRRDHFHLRARRWRGCGVS